MLLNTLYFNHHLYTSVPRHVREDMRWLADTGNDAVTVALLEQDLLAAEANVERLFTEADRAGLAVHVVPSRWGGLVAGAPKVPSTFTVTHPETWAMHADGTPWCEGPVGPVSSVHHPATLAFFEQTFERLLARWPVAGIVWDEPKAFATVDHSDAAKQALGEVSEAKHLEATARFYERATAAARRHRPDLTVTMFLYAYLDRATLDIAAAIEGVDYFGCDGRPWRHADPTGRNDRKFLPDMAPAFLDAARAAGKKTMFLVETHNMSSDLFGLLEKRLPEVLALSPDQLLYYYCPRNVDQPDDMMRILREHLRPMRQAHPAWTLS